MSHEISQELLLDFTTGFSNYHNILKFIQKFYWHTFGYIKRQKLNFIKHDKGIKNETFRNH